MSKRAVAYSLRSRRELREDLSGEADPFVPKEQVEAFKKEMKDAGAKVEVVGYPGAKHSFTNPDAGKAGMDALAYNAEADKKSWDAALKFIKSAFAR